jgi:hypothetical protein
MSLGVHNPEYYGERLIQIAAFLRNPQLASNLRGMHQLLAFRHQMCRTRTLGAKQMNIQARFETGRETAVREIAVIGKILADLVRTVRLIESDIAAEEARAGVSDRSDVKYPMLARTLSERRDNLKRTIAGLEARHTERAQHEQMATAA